MDYNITSGKKITSLDKQALILGFISKMVNIMQYLENNFVSGEKT